jgi:HSP90 family molecular chaperone
MAWPPRPPKPKTKSIPITGQSLFVAERTPIVEKQNPDLTRVQLYALMNDEWMKLDDVTRAAYERKADYSRRTESRRESSLDREKLQDDSESKVSAYSMFVKKRHELLKETNPEMTVSDRAKTIAQMWAGLSKPEKLPYVNEAKRETRKLQSESPEEEGQDESYDE